MLLFLHGGPGMPAMYLAHKFQSDLERDFVVVHWDRRGAGKSFDARLQTPTFSVRQTLNDTYELTEALRLRVRQPRIYLVGHSWGSYLCNEREPAGSLRDKSNVIGGCLSPLMLAVVLCEGACPQRPPAKTSRARDHSVAHASYSGCVLLIAISSSIAKRLDGSQLSTINPLPPIGRKASTSFSEKFSASKLDLH